MPQVSKLSAFDGFFCDNLEAFNNFLKHILGYQEVWVRIGLYSSFVGERSLCTWKEKVEGARLVMA
jgi:hypothetical protein